MARDANGLRFIDIRAVMGSRTKPSVLALLEAGLLVGGISLLIAFVFIRGEQDRQRDLGLERFYDSQSQLDSRTAGGTAEFDQSLAVPDQTLWSEQRVQAYQQTLAASDDMPLGVLIIDRLSLEAPVYDGADELNLNRGLARIKGTSTMDASGNLGIAGHRDGFFRGLKDVQEGDLIRLQTPMALVTYRVAEIVIVDPTEVSVLAPTPERTLTLVTCYPFYFVGQAPKRYIVKAHAEQYLANN